MALPTTAKPSHTIQPIPPPGRSILAPARQLLLFPLTTTTTTTSSSQLSPHLTAAFLIRKRVFVDEQHCDPLEEVDADDAVSWHWVLYASYTPNPSSRLPSASHTPESDAEARTILPAATIRLVPVNGRHGGDLHWELKDGWGSPDYAHSKTWDGREGYVKIGRLATVKEARGRGLGRELVEECVRFTTQNGGEVRRGVGGMGEDEEGGWKGLIGCHAQAHLEGWYGKLGFVRDEGMGTWEEDGIPHVGMWMRVDV